MIITLLAIMLIVVILLIKNIAIASRIKKENNILIYENEKQLRYVMNDYLKKVKEQLYCNASKAYRSEYITYNYTNEQIDDNLDYFKKCNEVGLSPYKALLFFHDYLNGDYTI